MEFRPPPRAASLCLAVLLLARGVTARDGADLAEPGVRFVGSRSRSFEWWVSRAFTTALSRLDDPRCRQLFSDFRDASGRTPQSRLDEMNVTAQGYLLSLYVRDADLEDLCRSSRVLAGTRPGSRVIVFCGGRFRREAFHNPALGAAVILHEELHSLGVPENPPSSLEITQQALLRCPE